MQRFKLFSYLFCLFITSLCFTDSLSAQALMGRVMNPSKQAVSDAYIDLIHLPDSQIVRSYTTDSTGRFRFMKFGSGDFYLKVTHWRYEPQFFGFSADSTTMLRKEIQFLEEINVMKGGGVTFKKGPMTQKNDTVEYSAGSYKVNQDASAENLVTKMPGITNENGTIKAQGEEVKKVTVDGQDFFGSDAAAALKNLPAEVVDKIQVFDRASDQSQFSGVDDGNAQKTLNIVTKAGKNNGQFGKIYAGYGTDDRWAAGANINYFKGKNRLSLIGMSNNINQQNFTSSDILGALGSSASGGGMMQGMGRGGPGGMPNRGPGGMGGGDMSNFMVNQQGGINTTNSLGLNYSSFGMKKLKITASYFFNNGVNNSASFLNRTYFLSALSNQIYQQSDTSESRSASHRINARLEYTFDSSNSLIYTPSVRLQNGSGNAFFAARTKTQELDTLNMSGSTSNSKSNGYNINNNLLLRHRFKKAGQTISLNLSHTVSLSKGNTDLQSENAYYEPVNSSNNFKQQSESRNNAWDFSPNLSYTHPIKKRSTVEINYNPAIAKSKSYKYTQRYDTATTAYTITDSLLSNTFNNTTTTQRGGLTYRYKTDKFSFNIGAGIQRVMLEGDQSFPKQVLINRPFDNVLPNAMITYQPSKTKNLRIYYRSSANIPSINQLQNVINNSNPLILSSGNLSLKQEFTHRTFLRYSVSNVPKGRSLFLFGHFATTANYIANNNILAQSDTSININNELVSMKKGTQFNLPVNINGYRMIRTYATYAMPFKKIKSVLNFNLGQSYTKSPAIINNAVNFSNTYNTNAGLVVASNISEKLDFTLSYSANYNIVVNSLQTNSNSKYLIANFNAKLNYIYGSKFVFNTDITNSSYSGLGASFNQSIWLVNGGVGYKFLKDNRGELKLSVFDALKRNTSISRTVTESYIEDKTTQILTRFYMLTFTYSIRNFKAKK